MGTIAASKRFGRMALLVALSCCYYGCSCDQQLACPVMIHLDFDPSLDESGSYRVVVESTNTEHRVDCTFMVPEMEDDANCSPGAFGTLARSQSAAVTSLVLKDPALGNETALRVSIMRDGAELREATLPLSYRENERADSDGCGDCREAHAKP